MRQTVIFSTICGAVLGHNLAHVVLKEDQRITPGTDKTLAKGLIFATSITSYLIGGLFASLVLWPMGGNPILKKGVRLLTHLALGTAVFFMQVLCWDILLNKLQERGIPFRMPHFN
jgi:hypothetical protein